MRVLIICLTLLCLAACERQDFSTVSPDIDTTVKPRVELISPLDNAIMGQGIFLIEAYSNHYAGINYVQFKFGTKQSHIDYDKPYQAEWFVTQGGDTPVPEGRYQICALAVDNTGCCNSHCIEVTVKY